MNTQITNLKKLLQIIPSNHPALRVVHFANKEHLLMNILQDIAKQYDLEYQINLTDKNLLQSMQEKYSSIHTKIINFDLNRNKYMIQGKLYDFAFVTTPIEKLDSFLQKTHPIIKNSGNIIFLLPKATNITSYTELLEKNYFVATSIIDDLLENESVIISRKMHGWGG